MKHWKFYILKVYLIHCMKVKQVFALRFKNSGPFSWLLSTKPLSLARLDIQIRNANDEPTHVLTLIEVKEGTIFHTDPEEPKSARTITGSCVYTISDDNARLSSSHFWSETHRKRNNLRIMDVKKNLHKSTQFSV